MENIKSFETLSIAFDDINIERMYLANKLLKQKNRILPIESINDWILTHNRAPYINELFDMSEEYSDQ